VGAMIPTRTRGTVTTWLLLACALARLVGGSRDVARAPRETTLRIHTAEGSVAFDVEVADDDEERITGLRGREHLPALHGMAFVWEEPVETSFTMKDTLIPLSIAFWDERGRIVSILHMTPCDTDLCPTYGPHVPFVGALEVDRGSFTDLGVRVGDRVELEGLSS